MERLLPAVLGLRPRRVRDLPLAGQARRDAWGTAAQELLLMQHVRSPYIRHVFTVPFYKLFPR